MTISELSVRRPVLMTMVYAVLIIIAVMFLPNLQISLYPSVSMPMITVMVSCTGAGPEEIESQVTEVLENSLSSVKGLESMTSRSSEGMAMVMLEFGYDIDLDEASDNVTATLSRINRSLPDWADTPEVMNFNSMSSSSEIMNLTLSGDYDSEKLYSIAKEDLSALLLRIDGVEDVSVRGFGQQEYVINLDPDKMEQYDLTISDVTAVLSSTNTQGKGGTITEDGMDYSITIDGRYSSVDRILDTLVATIGNNLVRISDLGKLSIQSQSSFRESYVDGESVISLSVSNSSDSTASTVAGAIKDALPSIQEKLGSDVQVSIQRDSTSMITSTMNEVYTSAILGIIFAAAVIFLFLRGIKTTFIIALSMPICILFTLLIMSVADISINTMSMSGLILGIGMIVDASIIILENTYRIRESGANCAESAILGSHNMVNAITASTLTTICVFVPLIIFKAELGAIGMMFQDLIWTVCISLICSLFVSVTLVPALSGSIIRINTRVQKPLRFRLLKTFDNICIRVEHLLENAYASALDFCLKHKLLIIVLCILLLVYSLSFVSNIGMSLTPQMSADDSVTINLSMPSGTNKAVTRTEVFRIADQLYSLLPKGSFTNITCDINSTSGTISIGLPDLQEQVYSASDIKTLVRPILNGNPDAIWTFGGRQGPMSSSAIDIAINSNDTEVAQAVADEIIGIINTYVPDALDVQSDLATGAPKLGIVIDHDMCDFYDVSISTIYTTLYNSLSGVEATILTALDAEQSYSLVVQLDESKFSSIEELGSLLIATKYGNVRLDTLTDFEYSTVPRTITRENKVTVSHVTANLADNSSSSVVTSQIRSALDQYLLLPDGVTISMGGDMAQMKSYSSSLVIIVLLALLLVFAVMAAQFESLIDPFIIFATIPMMIIGVVAIHIWANQDFTLYSIVGIIALIGVVVNNGIVMVDSINQQMRKKIAIHEACLKAAHTRLRPILMTTLTTVIGMMPLAFFPGEGAESMQPIALTFLGGLTTGACMTLFLSPVL
ncbi:MAG: efflux RND transporter permease subunit, partial [Sphaerochaetaceae bacterium]